MRVAMGDCPNNWDYEDDPSWKSVVPAKSRDLIVRLRTRQLDTGEQARDTRRAHRHLFTGLTPQGHGYFAGNYRGTGPVCLSIYEVQVQSDPRVGWPAREVPRGMDQFAGDISNGLAAMDSATETRSAQMSSEDHLLYIVHFISAAFVRFLEIHPYANGNGHMGRYLLWTLFVRYGYPPRRHLSIDPRPSHPEYGAMIAEHRSGKPDRLVQYLLSCL